MPTEELFEQTENNQQTEDQGINQLLSTLPEDFSFPLSSDYIDAFVKIFMGTEAYESLGATDREIVKKNIEEKVVNMCLLISAMISGIPLPAGFPQSTNINGLLNN